jgi:hypothetical protein
MNVPSPRFHRVKTRPEYVDGKPATATADPSWSSSSSAAVACLCTLFAVANGAVAFRHVMWRDEWMPLNVARFATDINEWFTEIKYIGRWAFFGLIWLIEQCGGHPWLFKLVIVSISTLGVYIVCRYAPFSWPQKALFAFGYYPFYEYGTILRDYSIIWTTTMACCALLASPRRLPLAFGLVLAVLFQTNPFGLGLGCAFGAAYVFDLWRAIQAGREPIDRLAVFGGAIVAAASFLMAVKTMMPPPEIAEMVLGQPLRSDSHLIRLMESLPFPARAWLPIPIFGQWNSQILDPWPWAQIAIGAAIATLIMGIVRLEPTAAFLFGVGMLCLGAILCHVPWTALRYHGPYFLLVVCAYWILEARRPDDATVREWRPIWRRAFGIRKPLFTGLLLIHAVVAAVFIAQEQVIPFSGSRAAAAIIREKEPPDVLIVGDPDYAMISLCGYLDREVYIASRREPGAFTRVDKRRRGTPLSADELSTVVLERLSAEKRDIVLVTNYPINMPSEMGTLLGVTNSITDERYHIFRIRYRRSAE